MKAKRYEKGLSVRRQCDAPVSKGRRCISAAQEGETVCKIHRKVFDRQSARITGS